MNLKTDAILSKQRQAEVCLHLFCLPASILTCSRSVKGHFLLVFPKMITLYHLFFLICCYSPHFCTRCMWRDISLLHLSPHLWEGYLSKAGCHLRWRDGHAGLGIWTHWDVSIPTDCSRYSNLSDRNSAPISKETGFILYCNYACRAAFSCVFYL